MPSPSATPPRAILFDCDGTLLLTGDLHFAALSQAVARQGAAMDRHWYDGLTGLGRRDLLALFCADHGVNLDLAGAIEESIALTTGLARQAQENPAVAPLARQLSGHLPIAVVTNSETAVAHALLAATALLPLFDLILAAEDAPRPKPAPDLYLSAAARLGISPQDCLVLEDSDQGLAAAAAAGMHHHDVRGRDWPQHCDTLRRSLAPSPAPGQSRLGATLP